MTSPRHRLLASALLAALLVTTACTAETGSETATADTEPAEEAASANADELTTGPTDESGNDDVVLTGATIGDTVFDSSVVHAIGVEFDDADYEAAITAYVADGSKEWIEATVTIDGATYENVGIRLKGNSSLRGLTGVGGGPAGDVSADSPEDLPWLIRLDKYVDDQAHEGIRDFVVRSNNSETSLNEAVALDLLDAAGLASQDAMAVRFSVNGSDAELRLVIEHPDDVWMADNFDEGGALYKAESTGDYSYRGDDPDAYDEVFDQEAGRDNADLTPLIEFLDFINNSDDATFAAEIGDRLDVDAFATYLAMQDIVQNFDDIDGPGNNSYLYYDTETEQFTVVPWDYNLAFGGVGGVGRGPGGGGAPGEFGGERPSFEDAGVQPPGGAGGAPPDRADAGGRAGPGAGLGGSNVLVERLRSLESFTTLLSTRAAELQADLIDSGLADRVLAEWVAVLENGAADVVGTDTIQAEAVELGTTF